MRTIGYLSFALILFVVLLCAGCTANTGVTPAATATPAPVSPTGPVYPDLTGTWTSSDEAGWNLNSTIQPVAIGQNTWVFSSQDRYLLRGFKLFRQPTGESANQTVVGIIDPDGKSVTIIDQPGGSAKATLTGPDTLFVALTYANGRDTGGNSFAMAMTLHRVPGQAR